MNHILSVQNLKVFSKVVLHRQIISTSYVIIVTVKSVYY